MNIKINKKICILFLILFIIPNSLALSLGISPSSLDFEKVIKGGYSEKKVYLSTTSKENIYVFPEYYGEIKDWINVTNKEIVLNSDAVKEVNIAIMPPNDVRNGIYEGKIIFMASPKEISAYIGSGLITTVSLRLKVEIIGEEIIDCNIGAIEIEPLEENFPLIFHAVVLNKGNVRIKPRFNLDIWNKDQTELIFSKEFISEEVLPTISKKISYEIEDHDLIVNEYLADINVKTCGFSKKINFNVEERGIIIDKGELLRIELKNKTVEEKELVPIKGVFKNTGERTVSAKFKGQVYKEGKIIDIIESDEYYVEPDEIIEIESFYQANKTGNYEIKGKIIYNEKESYEKSTNIEVKTVEVSSKIKIFVFIIIILVILVLSSIIILKKRKRVV